MRKMKVVFLILLGGIFLYGAQPSNAMSGNKASSIPAKLAIAPVKLQLQVKADGTADGWVELKSGSVVNVAGELPKLFSSSIENYLQSKGMFLKVKAIDDQALPSSASIAEIAQAGRDIEADIVMECRLLQFSGKLDAGFSTVMKPVVSG